jgi:hypothetical protein
MKAIGIGASVLIVGGVLALAYGSSSHRNESHQYESAPALVEKNNKAAVKTNVEAGQALVLANDKLGALKLDGNTKLDLQGLRAVLVGLSVTENIGQQDGPDFVYYQVSDDKGEIFWIKAQDDDPNKIDAVHVTSPQIIDQFGLKIGSTYAEILRARPGVIVETDDHFHTYVGHPEENIAYELAVPYASDYDGPDRSPTKPELERGVIEELIWLPR